MIYGKYFAKQYDKIYKEKFYKDYSDFIKRIIKERGIKNPSIFDIGCGTGRMIKYFKNWKCHGIDSSEEMVKIAQEKNKKAFISVGKFNSKIEGKFDIIISTFDTINYILTDREMEIFFENIKNYITDTGVFIFDFNTKYKKIPAVIKKEGFIYNSTVKNGCWKINITADHGYSEKHKERFYSFEEMENAINKSGMRVVKIYSNFNKRISNPGKSERLILIVENKKEQGA